MLQILAEALLLATRQSGASRPERLWRDTESWSDCHGKLEQVNSRSLTLQAGE